MNLQSIVKVITNSREIAVVLGQLEGVTASAVDLKNAIANDLKELGEGALTFDKIDSLLAAEKLLHDVGVIVGEFGALTGNAKLAAIGAALSYALNGEPVSTEPEKIEKQPPIED